MTKRDKLRKKIRNNPKNVKFSELETLLLGLGFALIRVKGSHHFFQYLVEDRNEIVVVPVHSNLVKERYVRDAIVLLDELFPPTDEPASNEDANDD